MSKESSLWKWLKKSKQQFAGDLDIHRVENYVSQGMPDVEGYLRHYGQFWCELKSAPQPARTTTPVRFKVREAQVLWLTRRWLLGGNAWMLLQVGSGHKRCLYLVPGRYSREVCDGLTEDELFDLNIGPPEGTKSSTQTVFIYRMFRDLID